MSQQHAILAASDGGFFPNLRLFRMLFAILLLIPTVGGFVRWVFSGSTGHIGYHPRYETGIITDMHWVNHNFKNLVDVISPGIWFFVGVAVAAALAYSFSVIIWGIGRLLHRG